MSDVWKDIWTSLRSVVGATASAVAFGLVILGSLRNPGVKVQFDLIWLAVVGLAVVSVLAAAIKMASDARRLGQPSPPTAISVLVRSVSADDARQSTTLIMGRSRQFGVNILATVYCEEYLMRERGEMIEESIGIGQVINIQENGLIQVRVLKEESNHAALWQRIRDRETAILACHHQAVDRFQRRWGRGQVRWVT